MAVANLFSFCCLPGPCLQLKKFRKFLGRGVQVLVTTMWSLSTHTSLLVLKRQRPCDFTKLGKFNCISNIFFEPTIFPMATLTTPYMTLLKLGKAILVILVFEAILR